MRHILKKALCALTSISIILGSVTAAAAYSAADGQFYFRYRTALDIGQVVDPGTEQKEVVAYYVGAIDVPFSELLPLKPEWQDDAWRVKAGFTLPAGIVFNTETRTFEGTPTSEVRNFAVQLEGIDANANAVAEAKAVFEIHAVRGKLVKVDFYAHTNHYKVDELAIPSDLTIDSWKNVLLPPAWVAVRGPYFEGTPTEEGRWPIYIEGSDYEGDVVATFMGYYTVEDHPYFNTIKDNIVPLPINNAAGPFDFGAPSPHHVRRAIDPKKPVKYYLEKKDDLAAGTYPRRSYPTDLNIYGYISKPYETATIRYHAVDSDGTEGWSNWFTYGTKDPDLACASGSSAVIDLFTNHDFNGHVVPPDGSRGIGAYVVKSGRFPDGLSMASDGKVSGRPLVVGQSTTVNVDMTFAVNGEVTPPQSCPMNFRVYAGDASLVDATPLQDRNLRVGKTYDGVLKVKGGITTYTVAPTSMTLPSGFAFKTAQVDTPLIGVMGVVASSGLRTIPFKLANGDGNSKVSGALTWVGYDPLAFTQEMTDVQIRRLDDPQAWGSIPVDLATVIPDVSGKRDYPELTISNSSAMPDGVALKGLDVFGSTDWSAGQYGPFTVSVVDYDGIPIVTNPFGVTVLPRQDIKQQSLAPPTFTVRWDKPQTASPLTVKQPYGARNFAITWAVVGAAPDWLSINSATGELTARAQIPYSDLGQHGPFQIKATDQEGSSVTSDPFVVTVADWPAPAADVTDQFRGTVTGDPTFGETATTLAIPGPKKASLADYVVEKSVIGGRAGVTFLSAQPSNPAGLRFDAASATFSGTPTEEFDGDVDVTFEDAEGRQGVMKVPLEVRPYPIVGMGQTSYEIPRLANAQALKPVIAPTPDNASASLKGATPSWTAKSTGFWNDPKWELDTTTGVPLPSDPTDVDPLHVVEATGVIAGRTASAVGASAQGVVLRATSNGANGELLVSRTAKFDVRIGEPAPLTLSYDRSSLVWYLAQDANGALVPSGSPFVSPTPEIGGSYVEPLTYSLEAVDAGRDGLTGTVGINSDNGNVLGAPDRLSWPKDPREWTVYAVVTDAEGRTNLVDGKGTPLTVRSTLAGYVQRTNGGETFELRQDELFKTYPINLANVVGRGTFKPAGALPSGLDFETDKGDFLPTSAFGSPGERTITVGVTDEDARHYSPDGDEVKRFSVVAPLAALKIGPVDPVPAKQYTPGSVDASFAVNVTNVIDGVRFFLNGDLPGTVVYREYDDVGTFTGWSWTEEGGEQETLPAATPNADDLLPWDALVFDTKDATLKGSPSKAGTFTFDVVARDRHRNVGYAVDRSGKGISSNRTEYNEASAGPFTLEVAAADPLTVSNVLAGHDVTSETLHQFTNGPASTVNAVGAAAGRPVTWTMLSGALPEGVAPAPGANKVVYSGYPQEKGTYPGIVWEAKDAAGRTARSDAMTFVVGERLAFALTAAPKPWGVLAGADLPPFSVNPSNAANAVAIPAANWQLPASGMPSGLSMVVKNNRPALDGTSTAIGDYTVTVGADDSLGTHAETDVQLSILDPNEKIDVTSDTVITKADVPVSFPLQITSRTFGQVRFTSTEASVDTNGVVTAQFATAGDKTASVTVSDSTGRQTVYKAPVTVMDHLTVDYPPMTFVDRARSPETKPVVANVLGTVSYKKGSGNWPAGLDVDASTGAIVGLSTALRGTYAGLKVDAVDAFTTAALSGTDARSSNAFSLFVDGTGNGFSLVNSEAPAVEIVRVVNNPGDPLTISTRMSAWDLPVSAGKWTVDRSSLPAGIVATIKDGEVEFSGTPTAVGNFQPFTVTATDELGQQASLRLSFKILPPGMEIGLTMEGLTTKAGVPFTITPSVTASTVYGATRFYSYDIDGDPQTHEAGQYVDDLDIDIATGVVTGKFDTIGNRDFDVYVTDATKRVKSQPVVVNVIPYLRITVPSQVATNQGDVLARTLATDYALGTVVYAQGAGNWPKNVTVDPKTGQIYSTVTGGFVTADVGTYPDLTIDAVDTFVVSGITYTDSRSSNPFAIIVGETSAAPDIANQAKTFLGVQNQGIASWTPKAGAGWAGVVVEKGKTTKPYGGTVTFSLKYDVRAYGLTFDPKTGTISGTATKPFVFSDQTVKVTSSNGTTDETAGFWMGMQPALPMVPSAGQTVNYTFLLSAPRTATNPVKFDNVVGKVTYASAATIGRSVDPATGVIYYDSPAPAAWYENGKWWPVTIIGTDEFGRTGQFTNYTRYSK
jgi:hypothetical protein